MNPLIGRSKIFEPKHYSADKDVKVFFCLEDQNRHVWLVCGYILNAVGHNKSGAIPDECLMIPR